MISIFKKFKWRALIVFLAGVGLYYYFNIYQSENSSESSSFYVVQTVEKGEVTSGIQTTGEIIAAQKLDIDVYKQLSRIDVVNVQNGSHVEKGDVLMSFDKSDAYVDTQSAQVAVVEAELNLNEKLVNSSDPNTQINTLKNQIEGFKKTIIDAEQDLKDAYKNFLNKNLEVESHEDRYSNQSDRTEPVLSGRYVSGIEGQYVIEVYASGAESGYSYRVTGLEYMSDSVIFGKSVNVGSRGLKITFPDDTRYNDKWIIDIPNTTIATYSETKIDYEKEVADLNKIINDAKVNLANSEQELSDLYLVDGDNYRDLDVEKAKSSLAEARQRLSQNYDVVQDRDIVAPFSGSIEGMENVVVGATPTGGTEDSINLGTLISDEFLTTFTLGAADVAKVEVGQKVKVTVTSFNNKPTFEAKITQISSLPESSGVAQYEVQALLEYDRKVADIVLREGMLADIEIVEEEKDDVVRIPTSAISYEQGIPKITKIDSLTEEQKNQVSEMGIIKTSDAGLVTYSVEVKLGIVGSYYAEVLSGINVGDLIVSSSVIDSANQESVVQETRFGPPGSGNRQPEQSESSEANKPATSN